MKRSYTWLVVALVLGLVQFGCKSLTSRGYEELAANRPEEIQRIEDELRKLGLRMFDVSSDSYIPVSQTGATAESQQVAQLSAEEQNAPAIKEVDSGAIVEIDSPSVVEQNAPAITEQNAPSIIERNAGHTILEMWAKAEVIELGPPDVERDLFAFFMSSEDGYTEKPTSVLAIPRLKLPQVQRRQPCVLQGSYEEYQKLLSILPPESDKAIWLNMQAGNCHLTDFAYVGYGNLTKVGFPVLAASEEERAKGTLAFRWIEVDCQGVVPYEPNLARLVFKTSSDVKALQLPMVKVMRKSDGYTTFLIPVDEKVHYLLKSLEFQLTVIVADTTATTKADTFLGLSEGFLEQEKSNAEGNLQRVCSFTSTDSEMVWYSEPRALGMCLGLGNRNERRPVYTHSDGSRHECKILSGPNAGKPSIRATLLEPKGESLPPASNPDLSRLGEQQPEVAATASRD